MNIAASVTWVADSNPRWNRSEHTACLVHIYPRGVSMGRRYHLGADPIILGRDDDCHVQVDDHTVSRQHARIVLSSEGFRVRDLGSTNGTYTNQTRVSDALLLDGTYLQVGSSIFRFLSGSNVEASYHEEIYRATIIDALTGTYNRRYFTDFLEREVARSRRHHRPLSLVLIDIDHFKNINDTWGHLCGDYTLRELTNVIRQEIRRDELLARFGGEEFSVTLPEADAPRAVQMAERIRAIVEQHRFHFEEHEYSLTVSLGIACIGTETVTFEHLIEEADHKLYEAKADGRNRVVC